MAAKQAVSSPPGEVEGMPTVLVAGHNKDSFRAAKGGGEMGERGAEAKKRALLPCLGRERERFVVPPKFKPTRGRLLLAFCCGKGTAPVSGAAGSAVFSGAVP